METHGWVVTVVGRPLIAHIGLMSHSRSSRAAMALVPEAVAKGRPGHEAEKQNSK